MEELKTVEEIKKKMVEEIRSAFSTSALAGGGFDPRDERAVHHVLDYYQDLFVRRAVMDFEERVKDRERHLALGKAADSFIQAMKLPPVILRK